ncbi:hypothetical protein BGZ65_005853, partial [Modicella reniformis]
MSDSAADGMAGSGAGSSAASSQPTTSNQAQHQQPQQQQQQQQTPAQTPQTQQEVDRIVLNYLNQKGYKQSEIALKREANLLSLDELSTLASAEHDAAFAKRHDKDDISSPDAYEKGYLSLRRWVQNSLDLYK